MDKITNNIIIELHEQTGAKFIECCAALMTTGNDIKKAVELLGKQGKLYNSRNFKQC